MASFHGIDSKMHFDDSQVDGSKGWDASITNGLAEVRDDQCSGWVENLPGFEDATASVKCSAMTERGTVAQLGDDAALALYLDDTHNFSFNAICTGITETADKTAGVAELEYSFEMNDSSGVVYA